MFKNKNMSVFSWWGFFFLMAIPFVNIVLYVVILLSKDVNKSLKSYLWAGLLPIVIFLVFIFVIGFTPAMRDLIDQILEFVPAS